MKIVIVVEEFDPDKGYLEFYLARELAKLGHKTYVFTFSRNKSISRTKLHEGFEVVRLPRIMSVSGIHIPSFRGIAYVARFIETEKPDIIHCQPLYSPTSLVFISCRRLFKYKIVGSLVTGEYSINTIIANLKYDLVKIITEHCLKKRSDSFFAIDEGWKKVLLQLFDVPASKIRIVPLGADSELFKFDAKARTETRKLLGLSPEDVVVVYSGKITHSKKLDLLLNTISPIIKKNQNVKLLIVGKGDFHYTEYLKNLSSNLDVSENVNFHPWVHRTKLPGFYSASDIAVWPGGVSISIIEAASVSLPLIVKRSLITEYLIEFGNGFAFEPDNINELRAYLEKLIYDYDLRKDMGRKSRLLVEEKLNWETIAHMYLETYKSILARTDKTRLMSRRG